VKLKGWIGLLKVDIGGIGAVEYAEGPLKVNVCCWFIPFPVPMTGVGKILLDWYGVGLVWNCSVLGW